MTSVSIRAAAQVLRPPEDGLPYLRHDRAGELTLEPGDVLLEDGRIAGFEAGDADLVVDAAGCAVVPGFVDCHTHLPFAGWRAQEYERKVTGVPYQEIARAGGGIASSARSLAESSDEDVLAQAETLARELLQHGTTAFEGKTGYGLSRAGEARAARLGRELAARVVQPMRLTGLFAHAVPPGTTADAWMDEAETLARECDVDALDIFVESVAFDNEHLARMGAIARDTGRALRAHVEQFAAHRSVPVALEWGARSVDHLSCLHPDDVAPLAASDCAAVLLPGAELLGGEHTPPARELADAGAIGVLATDLNPGTSPVASMPVIIGLGVRRYGWSVREALLAATLNAAWVLGWSHELGSLESGKRADVLLLDGPAEHVPYRFGHNPVAVAFSAGEPVWVRPDQAWRLGHEKPLDPASAAAGRRRVP
ncbi:MAG TPA: amidohydrolase family protein [Solirubrobacteraceae bacterium]|nr:amidohydrolase family protein [Solirubrobacteraceae bacterium]